MRTGTAGWSVPKQYAAMFAGDGTHLERYARCFSAVEINSSFYRFHKPGTYARWAASVPPHFRFAVKLPREITHRRKLAAMDEPLEHFLAGIKLLGDRMGPVLVQLPPGLRFEPAPAALFFETFRSRFDGSVVCEPRHPSWFTQDVDELLMRFRIARVAADPAPTPGAEAPGGWSGFVYRRLHGSPKIYYSAYSDAAIDGVFRAMQREAAQGRETWCIFDNTAMGAATTDSLNLMSRFAKG